MSSWTSSVASGDHRGIKFLYYLILALIFVGVAFALKTLFLPLVLGFLLAFLTDPLVDWLERRHMSRHAAALSLFSVFFLALFVSGYFLVPKFVDQIHNLIAHQNEYLTALEEHIDRVRLQMQQFLDVQTVAQIEGLLRAEIGTRMHHLSDAIPAYAAGVLHGMSYALFVPIIAFLFLVQGANLKKWVISFLPNRYFEMSLMMIHQVNVQLGSYLRGQALDCLVNGMLYGIGLSLLGVKGAVVMGCFAGLMNAIPYVGPVIGAIPGMTVLILEPGAVSPWWSVAILFTLIHLIDNALIYPMTVGKSLDLPPFAVILGILFGGTVAGIPGMFLTVPLLGMAKQMFKVFHSSLKSYQII